MFTDIDNSLGLGGSVVEVIGLDRWTLQLDDAASYMFDDDDNEMIIKVNVNPVPEPSTILLFFAGALFLRKRLTN